MKKVIFCTKIGEYIQIEMPGLVYEALRPFIKDIAVSSFTKKPNGSRPDMVMFEESDLKAKGRNKNINEVK